MSAPSVIRFPDRELDDFRKRLRRRSQFEQLLLDIYLLHKHEAHDALAVLADRSANAAKALGVPRTRKELRAARKGGA